MIVKAIEHDSLCTISEPNKNAALIYFREITSISKQLTSIRKISKPVAITWTM